MADDERPAGGIVLCAELYDDGDTYSVVTDWTCGAALPAQANMEHFYRLVQDAYLLVVAESVAEWEPDDGVD